MTTPNQPTQITLTQHALNTIDLANTNLSQAISHAEANGQGSNYEALLHVAELQVRVATASALLDIAHAIRETNSNNAIFSGLEKVAGAITAVGASPGFGDASRRI